MSGDTPSPLNNVITIDDERMKAPPPPGGAGHRGGDVERLAHAEADRLYRRQPLQLWSLS